jgi:hypothetical protein
VQSRREVIAISHVAKFTGDDGFELRRRQVVRNFSGRRRTGRKKPSGERSGFGDPNVYRNFPRVNAIAANPQKKTLRKLS